MMMHTADGALPVDPMMADTVLADPGDRPMSAAGTPAPSTRSGIDAHVEHALPARGAHLRSVEHPLNDSVRSLLRLEHLLQRWQRLVGRTEAVDHHHALLAAFEIMEVATRRDLREDLRLELEHQRRHLDTFRGNPSIAEQVLDAAIARIDDTLSALAASPKRVEEVLAANDFLIAIRSRSAIAGGLCAFDLPAYAHWQEASPEQRRADLHRWISVPLVPLAEALDIALSLLREGGVRHALVALDGRYQHTLTSPRNGPRAPQLARVTFDTAAGLVPEITANRLQLSIQFTRPDADGNLVPDIGDAPFELTLYS